MYFTGAGVSESDAFASGIRNLILISIPNPNLNFNLEFKNMIRYILSMGLNDKDTKTQKIQTLEAYKMAENVIKSLQFEGATIYESKGLYRHKNGEYVTETSLRMEFLFATENQIRNLVSILKSAFNQESIAVQVENVDSDLW